MNSKILVTGATGNVGAEVVKLLQAAGTEVVAAIHDPAKHHLENSSNISYVKLDFRQPETLPAAFAGVERVFLVRPPDISDASVLTPAVEAAKSAGVRQIVFMSLLGAESNKVVPHYRIEQLLKGSGLAWTFLRPSFFLQNLNTTHREDIRQYSEIFVPAGRGLTSFIDTRDIAAIAAKTLTEPGHEYRAYPLTGGQALSYYEVAHEFSAALDRPVRYANPNPIRFLWRETRQNRRSLPFALTMLAIYSTARFGLAASLTPDVAELLGRPPLTVRQYIEDHRGCWETSHSYNVKIGHKVYPNF